MKETFEYVEERCCNVAKYTRVWRDDYDLPNSEIESLWKDIANVRDATHLTFRDSKVPFSKELKDSVLISTTTIYLNKEEFLEEYLSALGTLSSDIMKEISLIKAHKERLYPNSGKSQTRIISKRAANKILKNKVLNRV